MKTLLGQVRFCTEAGKLAALIARAEELQGQEEGETFNDRLAGARVRLGELKRVAKNPAKELV